MLDQQRLWSALGTSARKCRWQGCACTLLTTDAVWLMAVGTVGMAHDAAFAHQHVVMMQQVVTEGSCTSFPGPAVS